MRRYLSDLSADFVRSVLDLSPETGEFRWRYRTDRSSSWNTRFVGKTAGSPSGPDGSWQIRINDRLYLGHRLAWLHLHGEWPPEDVDHKNGNPGSNGEGNLRAATPGQNLCNRGPQRNNTSGFKGVNFDKQTGRWRAKIKAAGKFYDLGRHDTPEAAAAAYKEAAERLHGEFARAD